MLTLQDIHHAPLHPAAFESPTAARGTEPKAGEWVEDTVWIAMVGIDQDSLPLRRPSRAVPFPAMAGIGFTE